MAVLHGNLAPRGAVIKHSAASPRLLQHTGRAVVFDSVEDMTLRVDDPALDVTADDVLVLRNAGPKGAPGMPEAGYLPIPMRSEEHTSELQSLRHLVCRLLLEKKKNTPPIRHEEYKSALDTPSQSEYRTV